MAAPGSGRGAALRRAAAVAVAVALGPAAIPSAAAAPPVLSSVLTVTASTTSYTEVTLTKTLSIPESVTPAVTVKGGGFVAVALVRVQRGPWPPGLAVTRLAGTSTFEHVWVGRDRGTNADDDPPTWISRKLPPGRYRLYLLTSGAATVTWRLPLRAGTTKVAPKTRTTHSVVSSASAGVPGSVVAPAHAEQVTGITAHRGLAVALGWYTAYVRVDALLGHCVYPGQPSALGLGPAPACLLRDAGGGPTEPAVDDHLVGQGSKFVEPGTWTVKGYFRIAGALKAGGVSAMLLDLGAGYPAS